MVLGVQATARSGDFGDAVWHADRLAARTSRVIPSGYALLDAQLPGGGWPQGALCEVLQSHNGQGEWHLLLPALCAVQHPASQWVTLIAPPFTPFGPALAACGLNLHRLLWVKACAPAQRQWATEQALRCTHMAAVLAWLPQVAAAPLRRLHLGAVKYAKLLFVMRPATTQNEASPAELRLLLSEPTHGLQRVTGSPISPTAPDALHIQLLKRRGPPLTDSVVLPATTPTTLAPPPDSYLSSNSHAMDRLVA